MAEQPFSHLHCSLNGRSWTDPLTNSTFLAEVELERYLRSLFMIGDEAPPDVQLAFFHEATHHWCFHSPVGATLAFLQMRARRRAFSLYRSKAASDDEEAALLEDLIRYETATRVMRPLAEGLALFAEFDVGFWGSSTSPVVSQLNQWANLFFQSQEIVGDRLCDFPPVPPVRLIGTRLSKEALTSKAGLLVYPLTCANDPKAGYLPSYLLVKNLWHLAAGKCEHLRASDLFLTYLRCFFYEDYGFVAALLDPSTWGLETANAITIYFSRRLQQFMDSDFTDVTRFEEEILEKLELHESGIDTIGSGLLRLCTTAQADQLGRKRFQALIDETSIYSPDFLDDMLRVLNQATLFQRDIMCVGSLQVSLSISRERDSIRCRSLDDACKEVVLSKGGKVLLRLLVHPSAVQRELCMACQYDSGAIEIMVPYAPAPHTGQVQVYFPSEIEEGESEGSLNLFFSQSATYKVCVISRGEKPIAYLFLDPQALHQEETGEAARKLFMERHIEKPFLEKTHVPLSKQILEDVVDKCNPLMKLPLEHIQKHINSNMNRFYLSFALLHVQDEKLEECINAMRKHGFYEILGKDGGLVRALALLDTSTSLTTSREVIARWFSSFGLDLDTTIAALRQYGEQYNLPRILERGNGLGCLV